MITLNALFARLAARLVEAARRRARTEVTLDPATLFVPAETDDGLRGPKGTWIEGPLVRDADTLQVRW